MSNPDLIEPMDVLAAVAVNGFYNANAAIIRSVHRGLAAACNPILPSIPRDADLLQCDPTSKAVSGLLRVATAVPRVLISVATKVLHRESPALIPTLDNEVLTHCFGRLSAASQDKTRAAAVAIQATELIRVDLTAAQIEIDEVVASLAVAGFMLTPVRVLEGLMWTEVEERGYHR